MKLLKRILIVGILLAVSLPVLGLAALSVGSQDGSPPGVTEDSLADCPDSPNCVCSVTESPEHQVSPISFEGDPQTAQSQMTQVLSEIPRATSVSQTANYLHFVVRSAIFRFPDDVELLLDEESNVFQVRSASRTGESDLGVNRERVEEIRRKFQQLNSPS